MDTIWPQLPFQNRLAIGSSQTHSPVPDYCPLLSGVPAYQGRLVICPLSLEYPLQLTESHFPFQGSWKAPSSVKPSWIFQLKLVCSSLYTPMAQGRQVYSAFFLLYTIVNTQIGCLGYGDKPFWNPGHMSPYLSTLGSARWRILVHSMHAVLSALGEWGQVGSRFVSGKPLVKKSWSCKS